MKQLIYVLFAFLFITLSVSAFSQDWIPIAENDTYHYELVGDTTAYDSITNFGGLVLKNTNPADATISINSTVPLGQNTYYELNKVVTGCETCPWSYSYRNQPQFLQHRMVHFTADDKIVFQEMTEVEIFPGFWQLMVTGEWKIYPKAQLGATWIFDDSTSVSAEVTSVEAANILGNPDSLKTISLSTGEEIVLSKEHGIIRFPKFDDGTYYELIGIQTRDLGFTIPGAVEIYNFEVGDVFQYYDRLDGFFPLFKRTTQVHILNKEEFIDSIRYNTKRHTYNIEYDTDYFPDLVADTTFTTAYPSYTFDKEDMRDITPGTLLDIDVDNCYSQFNFFEQSCEYPLNNPSLQPNRYLSVYYGQNEADKWVKFAASKWSGSGVPSSNIVSNFSLEGSEPDLMFFDIGCLDRYFRVWEEGLGETTFLLSSNGCEYDYRRYLEGYIKNGDTTGIITPYDVTTVINPEVLLETDAITVFPNPTNDDLQIKLASGNYQVSILDITGSVYQTLNLNSDYIIDVAQLPTGLYFVEIKNLDNNKVHVKKIIKE